MRFQLALNQSGHPLVPFICNLVLCVFEFKFPALKFPVPARGPCHVQSALLEGCEFHTKSLGIFDNSTAYDSMFRHHYGVNGSLTIFAIKKVKKTNIKFFAFPQEFNLIDRKELVPLQELIEKLTTKDR